MTKNECFRLGLVSSILQQHGIDVLTSARYATLILEFKEPTHEKIIMCLGGSKMPVDMPAYLFLSLIAVKIENMLMDFHTFKIGQINGG